MRLRALLSSAAASPTATAAGTAVNFTASSAAAAVQSWADHAYASDSIATAAARWQGCHPSGSSSSAEDAAEARRWALVGLVAILVGGSIGVLLPLLGQRQAAASGSSTFFALGRAFAAGVVLATGLVHMMPAAMHALEDPCLGWPQFPWASVIATAAALLTNAIEFAAGQYFSGAAGSHDRERDGCATCAVIAESNGHAQNGSSIDSRPLLDEDNFSSVANGEAAERHIPVLLGGDSDTQAAGSSSKRRPSLARTISSMLRSSRAETEATAVRSPQGGGSSSGATWAKARRVATAQVLELGIALHSVLIGVALGVSDSPAAVRPLAAALVFHQFFEGFALGGALTEAGLEGLPFLSRAAAFAVTTPTGVAVGLGLRETYSARSPAALIVNGAFNGASAGILVYMALVDLIAIDFFSTRMRSAGAQMQVAAYIALFGGAAAMSLLAIWA